MKNFWQKFGKSLLMPISTIAAAGLILGIAAALQNPAIVGENFISLTGTQNFIGFIRKLSGLVFGNLPIFFAISLAAGLAKEEKTTAIYAVVLGYLAFNLTLSYLLELNGLTAATTSVQYLTEEGGLSAVAANSENARFEMVLGFFTYRMNVFGGILVGLVVAFLHNKFYRIELPSFINFFGGKRFIPILTLLVIPFVAVISYFVWPYFDWLISQAGLLIQATGVFGTFIFGFLNRLLIPTGLHHILNQLVRFTPIGGTAMIAGDQVSGALNIYSTALATPDTPISVFQLGTRFIGQGHMLTAMFALPGAALAMYRTAAPNQKKRVKTLLIAGVAASIMTGVTEPIEFTFMFISPILFIFHAIMTGIGYMILAILKVSVGNVQAGFIDFIIFGVLRGLETKWYLIPLVGAAVGAIYYYAFTWIIQKFNVSTPGRAGDLIDDTTEVELSQTDMEIAEQIVQGLGGLENIAEVENCFTRLRVQLVDGTKVDEAIINQTQPTSIIKQGANHYHIVYGMRVEKITQDVKQYLTQEKKRNE